MIAEIVIIIAIAGSGVLMVRFRKRWLAKINIILTNRITSYVHRHSALSCASSRHSRGKGCNGQRGQQD